MKKLSFLAIFTCLFALGSDQDRVLSHKETAQLFANFLKLPNELKQQIIPEYCSELKSLVYLKPIPQDNSCYWTNLLDNLKSHLVRSDGCIYRYIHNDKEYPVYINGVYFRGCQPVIACRRHLGPNENNTILLKNYLLQLNKASEYKHPSVCEKFISLLAGHTMMVKPSQKSLVLWKRFNNYFNSGDFISDEAVLFGDKYLLDQRNLCLHPTQNIFVSRDAEIYLESQTNSFNTKTTKLPSQPRINITHYDEKTKSFSIASINVENEIVSCAFDNSELSQGTVWGIDNTHKLLRFNKTSDTYTLEQFKLSHDVVSLHQLRDNPKLLLLNSDTQSYLYQIQNDRRLKLIKKFDEPATFLQQDDNLSVRKKYQQEHVVVFQPLTSVIELLQKQSAKSLVDTMPKLISAKTNLKQRIVQIFQAGKDIK